ncbi:MAG: protoheme IX farnesyltransferase [Gammaproteobacteria bacterium]|nr:protoheme IX farnesyltransferase [Gammaproteobacteria bacterium]
MESVLSRPVSRPGIYALCRAFGNVCKLRIGSTIAFTALAGIAVTPGPALAGWQIAVLGLAVLISAAAAGGFNQYMERDLDAAMRRTCNRPFVNGTLAHGPVWLWALAGMLGVSVAATAWATNVTAAVYVFLGAFFYGVVYTVWLKRRTSMNIVIGGLAGSFAIMAGASAVTPEPHALPLLFALVLFLWTPSHFWSFAIAMHDDYARARVPMLPVLIGDRAAARTVLINTLMLVTASVMPFWFGLGAVYLAAALTGGAVFLYANLRMLRNPCRGTAMASFHASLLQLTLVLSGAMLDVHLMPPIA